MARWRILLAVSLALVLVALPPSLCWGDTPGPGSGTPVDGHPWDDQVTDGVNPDPGPGDPADSGCPTTKPSVTVLGSTPMMAGSAKWVGDALLRVVQRLHHAGVTAKHKSVGSRRR